MNKLGWLLLYSAIGYLAGYKASKMHFDNMFDKKFEETQNKLELKHFHNVGNLVMAGVENEEEYPDSLTILGWIKGAQNNYILQLQNLKDSVQLDYIMENMDTLVPYRQTHYYMELLRETDEMR